MSRTAWFTLCASGAFTCGVIYYVHTSQVKDRERLREGVIIDLERQQQKKIQNVRQLALQSDLTKILREQQKQYDEDDRRQRESGPWFDSGGDRTHTSRSLSECITARPQSRFIVVVVVVVVEVVVVVVVVVVAVVVVVVVAAAAVVVVVLVVAVVI
ncbi:protein PET117 homolog, mitochondrial [Elysia marginata]|uniref:Protein PET117 homolog, mitochondrial n=1 Tax=Elysia marginata TaxID=1093978 RepID=A0AAV4EPU0_9GAST|nr:protein PET117 homolog, mitochondrial [Elysia marginata]